MPDTQLTRAERTQGRVARALGRLRARPRLRALALPMRDLHLRRAEDLRGLAPALVATAGFDYLRDEGDEYARRLQEAGVPVVRRRFTSLAHGFVNMTGICPAAAAALVEVARDWRALLERTAP